MNYYVYVTLRRYLLSNCPMADVVLKSCVGCSVVSLCCCMSERLQSTVLHMVCFDIVIIAYHLLRLHFLCNQCSGQTQISNMHDVTLTHVTGLVATCSDVVFHTRTCSDYQMVVKEYIREIIVLDK